MVVYYDTHAVATEATIYNYLLLDDKLNCKLNLNNDSLSFERSGKAWLHG
jgi:hypothetical protein